MQVTFTTGHLEITRRNFSRLPRVGERVVLSTSEDGDTTAFRVLDVEWDMTGEEPTAVMMNLCGLSFAMRPPLHGYATPPQYVLR